MSVLIPARALIVGVAEYKGGNSLPAAVRNDVTDIAALLCNPSVGGVDARDITLLVDSDATADAIRAAFREIAASMLEDGIFHFYFSGHGHRADIGGGEQSWLLAHDADGADLAATSLSSAEITNLLSDVGARRQVLMIDACHAGGIGSTKGAPSFAPKGFGKSGIDALSQGAGRVLLTSSRPDELSLILPGSRNSLFTSALLEAFEGATVDRGDGMIGVLDIFDYVSKMVPKHGDQHPIFHAGDLETNFAIARRRGKGAGTKMDTNTLAAVFAKFYPTGPTHDEIWRRAGGDISRLTLSGTGTAQWHSAISKVQLGGGGVTVSKLVAAAITDYPDSQELNALLS
jgi:hypothetical protein